LRPEIIGHSLATNPLQALLQLFQVSLGIAQGNAKPIAFVGSPFQFARVAHALEYANTRMLQTLQIKLLFQRQRQTHPLARQAPAILETSHTELALRDSITKRQ